MNHANKLKQLNFSLAFGVIMVLVVLFIGKDAFSAYFFGETTQGQIVEHKSTIMHGSRFDPSDTPPKLDEIMVEYRADGQSYWLEENPHMYAAFGLIKKGDMVTISFDKATPEKGYLMDYFLFTRVTSLLAPFIIIFFIVLPPQWIYHYRKNKQF